MGLTANPSLVQTLDSVEDQAEQLAVSVHSTSQVSERVSRKIRELDTAQKHVNDTLDRIRVVVDRTSAIDGVKQVCPLMYPAQACIALADTGRSSCAG